MGPNKNRFHFYAKRFTLVCPLQKKLLPSDCESARNFGVSLGINNSGVGGKRFVFSFGGLVRLLARSPSHIWVAAVCAPPPQRKPMINVACSLRAVRDSPKWSIAHEKHQIKVVPTPPKFSICLFFFFWGGGGGSELASVLGMKKTTKSGLLLGDLAANSHACGAALQKAGGHHRRFRPSVAIAFTLLQQINKTETMGDLQT